MSLKLLTGLLTATLSVGFAISAVAQEILPFQPKPSGSTAGRTMQESTYSPLQPLNHLPKDAPNILVVLIDDVGPAQTDTYGGEIHTPTLSKIAKEGISYNRFHTTAMCSPTRAALLTGRNHHRVGNGQIGELANDWDGYLGVIPKSSATVAEVLKDYGYSTAAWASGTTLLPSTPPPPVPSMIGPPVTASSISTAFSAGSVAVRTATRPQYCLRRTSPHFRRPRLLSFERRPCRRCDQLVARTQSFCARRAVLHVLGSRRVSRPASSAEGMVRQV
jgi:Sulfatase